MVIERFGSFSGVVSLTDLVIAEDSGLSNFFVS